MILSRARVLGIAFVCAWAPGSVGPASAAQRAPSTAPPSHEASVRGEPTLTAEEVWTEVGDTRLYAVEMGSGQALIFLHGGLADHRAVMSLVRPLAERFRVVVPDLRSSGRSTYSGGGLTFDRLTRDLEAIMDHLGIDDAFVGGISSGTGPAIHFAMNRPERTLGLVVMQPVYAGAEWGYTEEQSVAFTRMDAVAGRAVDEGVGVLREMYFSQLPPQVAERAWAMASDFDPASVVTTSRFIASGVQPFQSTSDLEALRLPVLIIPGDDPIHPRSVSELYAQSIPDVRLEDAVWPHGAHLIGAFLDDVVEGSFDLSRLDWMTGHWATEALGGTAEEAWLPASGNAMHGVFRLTVDGALRFSEYMQITIEGADVTLRFRHFNPDYTTWEDQGEVMEFRLDEWDDASAVFVAMNDITPDRLVYAREDAGLRVEITGVPPFLFTRVSRGR